MQYILKTLSVIFFTSFITVSAEVIEKESKVLQTYFQYNFDEIQGLSELGSEKKISNAELAEWDEITKNLSIKNPLDSDLTRMYAYLYTAQREVAFLSYNLKGEFIGSIGPISSKVLKLFFPDAPPIYSDNYSEKLAEIVLTKIKQRLDDENIQMRDFPIDKNNEKLKDLPQPYFGLKVASCKPWLLKDPKQFRPPSPPPQDNIYWIRQAEVVKEIAENATDKQKQSSKFWAGKSWPKSGDSIVILNDYLFSHNIPIAKILCVRSIIAEADVDVDIALFYSKYSYLIKRPSAVNPGVPQHIPLPKHPSYPSGHSTWFRAWATILTHYFPNEKKYWFQLAEESGLSRIWGGIHYPFDHQGGKILGEQLGEYILQSPKICL